MLNVPYIRLQTGPFQPLYFRNSQGSISGEQLLQMSHRSNLLTRPATAYCRVFVLHLSGVRKYARKKPFTTDLTPSWNTEDSNPGPLIPKPRRQPQHSVTHADRGDLLTGTLIFYCLKRLVLTSTVKNVFVLHRYVRDGSFRGTRTPRLMLPRHELDPISNLMHKNLTRGRMIKLNRRPC